MANRRGTFLSDASSMADCVEYHAYPLGYAAENDVGSFQNPSLPGIKPSRHQRLPPRPSSIDVMAVSKSRSSTNPFEASTMLASVERARVVEQMKRPIERIRPPLSARELYRHYGRDERMMSEIGVTREDVMRAFSQKNFTTREATIVRSLVKEYDDRTRVGVGLVRPTYASEETRASQLLEQVKGIRTELQNLKVRMGSEPSAPVAERLLAYRRDLDAASKAELSQKLATEYNTLSVPVSEHLGSTSTVSQLKNELERVERGRLEGVYKSLTTLTNVTQASLQQFRESFRAMSSSDKDATRDALLQTVMDSLGVNTEEEVRDALGSSDIDKLVDFAKDNTLPLPVAGGMPSTPQLSEIMKKEGGSTEVGQSTDVPSTYTESASS